LEVDVRQVATVEELAWCHHVATKIWGASAPCSIAQMRIHALFGGVCLLAYHNSQVVGFTFSFPALYREKHVLWSHETGILPGFTDQGIGFLLKVEQRKVALSMGYREIVWTFDPLVARNAKFNLQKLNANIEEYLPNLYGSDQTDKVNRGMETDRFIVRWNITDELAPRSTLNLVENDCSWALRMLTKGIGLSQSYRFLSEVNLHDSPEVCTEIPWDFSELVVAHPTLARDWRQEFREVATKLISKSYRVSDIIINKTARQAAYVWVREAFA